MKAISLFLLIVMFLTVLPASSTVEQRLFYANTEGVNIRAKPDISSKILGKLSYKQYVLRLGIEKDSAGDLWYKIYDFEKDLVGYSASWLLTDSKVTIKGEDSSLIAKNRAEYLNVRFGPGREFPVFTTLKQNEKIQVTRIITRSDNEVWYKFKANNSKYYFVAAWYMEEVKEEPPTKPEPTPGLTAVSTDYVNLREGPSIEYKRIALVEKGNTVQVVGAAKNSSNELWYQIVLDQNIGWVYSIYFEAQSAPDIDTSPIGQEAITTDSVNLRSGPSTESSPLKVLPKQTKVQVVGVAKNKSNEVWYQVLIEKQRGWIRSDLMSIEKKERGKLTKYSWTISESGIDILVSGEGLAKPEHNFVDDPLRFVVTYDNTDVLGEFLPINLNIYPIVRVRVDKSDAKSSVIIDLIRRVPISVDYKEPKSTIIHITLPKIGEKYIEIGGVEIYSRLVSINGYSYLNLNSILSSLSITLKSDFSLDLYGREKKIAESSLLKEGEEYFIAVESLRDLLDCSILETSSEIFIDPVLLKLDKGSKETTFTFSLPPRITKLQENDKNYLVFYADPGGFESLKGTKRSGVNPPYFKAQLEQGFSFETNNNKVRIFQDSVPTGKLSSKIIVIDPGHGSYNGKYLDVGAIGPTGCKEAYVVMSIATRLKSLLEAEGAKVILTHDKVDDLLNPDLAKRVSLANSSGGDIFISIHLNASTNVNASGTETYYWYESAKTLAEKIQSSLIGKLGTYDRGVKKGGLYLCKNINTMPSILTEVVFISNPEEEKLCYSESFLITVAEALREGIKSYFNVQ